MYRCMDLRDNEGQKSLIKECATDHLNNLVKRIRQSPITRKNKSCIQRSFGWAEGHKQPVAKEIRAADRYR